MLEWETTPHNLELQNIQDFYDMMKISIANIESFLMQLKGDSSVIFH